MNQGLNTIAALCVAASALTAHVTLARDASPQWQETLDAAKGQTVYFNAWGGGDNINAYIRWAGDELKARYDIELSHVKVTDTANVVSRILAEKSAGRDVDGSVDLVWVNGENFRSLKQNDLLFGPFSEQLPNLALTDTTSVTLTNDFSTPVEGYESPWGGAQLTFYYDSRRVEMAPNSAEKLLEFAQQNPGLFSYPALPDFHGTTFVKQILSETISDQSLLASAADPELFLEQTEALWDYLDQLHPLMWREGASFPSNIGQVMQLVDDSELAIGFTFNPNDAAAAVLQGQLPSSVRSYVHEAGTIGNTHFVAIPYNSSAKQAAMVTANFLLSPEAQARKANIEYWGDPSVLDSSKLSSEQQSLFQANKLESLLPADQLGNTRQEPHVSWVELIEAQWRERYLSQ
ncbi:ABC transporter substrate-binding protein [Alginatibacterium sediminis]|uniref:ABC transporter substrate-binding protein n=1 Tax=Alginatibacterium sediminis TaxID=2164068 RepID=A0A420E8P7_9ALTE|nr:ABC transporter substrate-binding protein [Alginatibacterium sediminis]RKF15795.1 ABC transporter substrate-binding protein [Alginatibacterium sediminis]